MEFPLERVISAYRTQHDVTERVASEHERELRRFLVLKALNGDANYGMAGAVDDLWHTFILFTREYASFCQKVAGRFIHHTPSQERTTSTRAYERMLDDYRKVFGEEPPSWVWPAPIELLSGEKCRSDGPSKCG
jgi:hypothetical protein